jgi:hypothetical protein
MNFLVETKIEYTTQLVNIVTPFLYEGFKAIYEDAIKVAKQPEELKVFQTFLRKIPFWSEEIYNAELNRIRKDSEYGDILEDLLRAVIKANIMLLTNTTPDKKNKLKINFVVELSKFVHNSYIESAKAIFQNPFLLSHRYSQLELKRNQKECIEVIKISVTEAIRKMLPINIILKEYLGQSFTETQKNEVDNIDKIFSEVDKSRVMHLLKADEFQEKEVSYNLTKINDNKAFITMKKDKPSIIQTKKESPKQIHIPVENKIVLDENINMNDSDNSDKDVVGSLKKIENTDVKKSKEREKMPTTFKERANHDYPSISSNISESYIPKGKMEIFESYTMGQKSNGITMDTIKIITNEQDKKMGKKFINKELNI